MKLYAEIVFPLPLNRPFLYSIPERLVEKAEIGSRALSSFHNRMLTGFIVGLKKRRPSSVKTLKEISEVLDDSPVFSPLFLSFTRRLSIYSHSSWGEILQASLPPSYVLKSKPKISITEKGRAALREGNLSDKERGLLDLLNKNSYTLRFLQQKAGVKDVSSLLASLERTGSIRIERDLRFTTRRAFRQIPERPTQLEMDFSLDEKLFKTSEQMSSRLGLGEFKSYFLFGPEKKRESVYSALLEKTIGLKKASLFLVPEISLTEAVRERFVKRFGESVALIHSHMTDRQREMEWKRIKSGEARLVVGPRSALFSPLESVGLIVVDEEHDDSFHQKESPSYDARKGAWIRGKKRRLS